MKVKNHFRMKCDLFASEKSILFDELPELSTILCGCVSRRTWGSNELVKTVKVLTMERIKQLGNIAKKEQRKEMRWRRI